MILTYQYRVKDKGAKYLLRHAAACNSVWNECVRIQRSIERRYIATHLKETWPTAFDLIKMATGSAEGYGLHSDTVSAICRQFVKSRDKIRKCPRYRGKKSLGWLPFIPRAVQISDASVRYKKRIFRFWKSRNIEGDFRCGSFSQDARGRWYVNFTCEVVCQDIGAFGEVGIDLGLKTFATMSDGNKIENPRIFRKYEETLAKAQRAGNKKRVRAIHAKISNARKDFLHKQSTRLVQTYGRVVVGNVNSGKLAKTRMAKSVLDAGWSSFRNMISYKTRLRGGEYVEGDERYSTQVCSSCGCLTGPKGITQLGVRSWVCSECKSVHDRDTNSACNILNFAAEHRRPLAEIPVL